MGKLLFVDLSKGETKEELLDESLCRDFLGGYGIGARILYSRMKPKVDPLGPDNIFGVLTGPLTGTPATTGTRYTAVAKSALTGGWGDANSGGFFGPFLKFAGYDGVFFTGISAKPVYLFIDNGKAEIKDASHIWGKGTYETEKILIDELGKGVEVISIGPAGEKMALIASILTHNGADAAGRSGLGAVMGSKKLKAVAVRGNKEVPIADVEAAKQVRETNIDLHRKSMREGQSFIERRHHWGTTQITMRCVTSGDAPTKNWGGVGPVDLPDANGLSREAANTNVASRTSCWHCPYGCKGKLKTGTGEYKYPEGTHRPEYETQIAFGTMCLVADTEAIAMANHICNDYGLDTISAGTVIAFAMECYEQGIISKKDTDGIELKWGNAKAMVAMTEKIAKREGLGNILADGVKVAAEKIGKGAEKYAVHIGGQELGLHDPKMMAAVRPEMSGFGLSRYQLEATPGRHTQGSGPSGFLGHVVNASGICIVSQIEIPDPNPLITGFINAVTGWGLSVEDLNKIGERILVMRHAFNLREGLNPLKWNVHPRIDGTEPQKVGPLAGVKCDGKAANYWNLGAMDWEAGSTKPSKKRLLELGLKDVADDLWTAPHPGGPSGGGR